MGSKHKKKRKNASKGSTRSKRRVKDNKFQTKCDLCGEMFKGKDHLALTRHIYDRHTRSEDHACDTCGNRYTDKKGLVRHVLYIHLEYRPYKCRLCDLKFTRRDLFRTHLTKIHPQLDLEKETEIGSDQSWSPVATNKYMLPQPSLDHSDTGGEDGLSNTEEHFVAKCVICSTVMTPPTRSTLSKHLNAVHTESNTCEKCGNKYADKKGLVRHYLHVHFHFKPYNCTMCDRSFARKDHLRSHAHLHHQGSEKRVEREAREKLYECDNCNKWFVKEDSLARHSLGCTPNEGKVNVERILEKREVNGRVEYLIKWVGYNENESTWETEDSITGRRDDNERDRSDSEEDEDNDDSSPDDDTVMEDANDSEGDSDKDAYLDELYPSPHLCHIDIGVI